MPKNFWSVRPSEWAKHYPRYPLSQVIDSLLGQLPGTAVLKRPHYSSQYDAPYLVELEGDVIPGRPRGLTPIFLIEETEDDNVTTTHFRFYSWSWPIQKVVVLRPIDPGEGSDHYQCSICGHIDVNLDRVKRHCQCKDCGAVVNFANNDWNRSYCQACWDDHLAEQERHAFDKAEKVEEQDLVGPYMLYQQGGAGGQEGWFKDSEEFIEWLTETVDEFWLHQPEFLWLGEPTQLGVCSVEDVLNSMGIEDSYEEAVNDITGEDKLAVALHTFWERNKSVVTYHQGKRAVRLPYENYAEQLAEAQDKHYDEQLAEAQAAWEERRKAVPCQKDL